MASNSSGIKLGRAYVLIDAVDRTKQACNAALKNIATLADNVMAIGTNMTIAASIAVTLDASASRAFREFEDTMLKVKAKSKDTAGATVAAYDQLIQKAQELGRVTRFTAPQVAEAMAGMAAAGLSRSTIDKSIKNVLDLAIATGVEIPTASRIAMAAMQQFNMTAEQSAEICDVLSAAVNNSALNLEDIGETFKYAAPLAKEFGMDIKQLSVVIAALGNAGIKGSQAGTSLRQMMTKLAKPGAYDLEKFNKDFEANVQRDIVVNVGGVLRKRTRPILDILRDMGRAMDEFEKKHPDVDPQKKLAVFSDLFGRYAMTAGSTLSDNMKNLDTMMRAINNSSGTASKTAEIMNSGIGGMHYAFISAWQDVAIQYGKALNDTVKTFYSAFTRIAHVISSFIQNNKQIISVVTASTAATAGLGVAMMVSAAAVKTFAVVGGTFTSVVGTMTSAAYGFAIALNSWISPLISAQGILRALSATAASLVIPIRSVAGVVGSFAPRWNLPWQEAPAGARRLTKGQAARAAALLNAYRARVTENSLIRWRAPRPQSEFRGMRRVRPNEFFYNSLTNDYGRNNQYLRERMRLLRLTGFYDTTRPQHLLRSAELIRTRGLMVANNMALGRARWGAFFRPFTDALQRATRAVGQFGMQVLSSISRIGIHPIAGMRSMLGWAGSSLFAGLAPGGGILKGIGAMFSATFKAIRAMGLPILRQVFNLAVRIATAPLTWVTGLTAATLATGNLKNVLAGVYIGISAIGVGISKIYEQAKKVFSWIAERFVENMKQANAIIDPVLNLWKTSFVRIGSDVKSAFGTITRSIGAGRWGDAFKMLGATWRVIRAELSAVLKANWEHMKLTFMTSWNRVVDYFQSGAGVWGIVKWLVEGLWGITKYAVAGIYNAVSWGLAELTGYGHTAQIGGTTVWTRYGMANANAKYLGAADDVISELKKNKIELDLSKYPYLKGWLEAQNNPNWENETRTNDYNGRSYITSGYIRGVGYSLDVDKIRTEYQSLLLEAQALIAGKKYTPKTPENMYGWGYTNEQIEDQKARVAAVSNSAGNMDVSNDPGVIAARNALKETQKEMEGNVERQRAAEAEAALKEREEGVLKELGEEGVGRVTKAMEGFYDFSKVSENRRREMIAAAGEYITKMGISIDQFEKIIQTLINLPGLGGVGNAGLFSAKSNVEMYAAMANQEVLAAMDTITGDSFKSGFSFTLTDKNGDTIEQTLSRQKDGQIQTRFEQLQELAQVLNRLSPEQAQRVREQFVSKYGLEATENIEKALNVINNRSDGIDFTEEKNMYARNADSETAFGKLSQYEQENLAAGLRLARLDDTDEMKEAVAGGVFGRVGSKAVLPIIKTGSYRGAFGNTIDTVQTYQPEEQKEFSAAIKNANTMFGIVNKMNTTELDKKMRFYGINADGMTNMEKLQALKGKEGATGVQSVLMKAIKYQLAKRKDLSELEKETGLEQLNRYTKKFAGWIKAPENAADKPMLYSVVQANIQGMLATFKQFADNRNRVILDRRAKAEKDAKAAEEAKKKEAGEDVEGRLKKIQAGIDDLADCVEGKGSKALNINMEYA